MPRPDYLSQGERARLFPVLATTSKEGRTTSIVLACLTLVNEFGTELLKSVGQRKGKRSDLAAFTEVVFKGEKSVPNDRPDGLIVLRNGSKEWRALVEAKVGNNNLNADQIEKYRIIAKENDLDCVISISNQFATTPQAHPLQEVRKSRSKIHVYHWSWMFILTVADLLLSNESIEDEDHAILLNELVRFLSHESAGLRGFDRMPPEWAELNKLISAGGKIPAKSTEAAIVMEAWHQETRDLSLILSRQTETTVHQKLSRKHLGDSALRQKDELARLRETHQLQLELDVPDAAAPIEIVADIPRRTIEVGMSLKSPEDRVSAKARLNWLLRQIRIENTTDIFVRFKWRGRSEVTQFSLEELRADPSVCEEGKSNLQLSGFHIFQAKRLGARFTQQSNFISDLEAMAPEFYKLIGQELVEWRKSAPKIRSEPIVENETEDTLEIEDGSAS